MAETLPATSGARAAAGSSASRSAPVSDVGGARAATDRETVLDRVRSWVSGAVRRFLTAWRGNLQFRVVFATMLLCALVMTVLQTLIYQRVADNLVEGRMVSAKEDAAFGARTLQNYLKAASDARPSEMGRLVSQTLENQRVGQSEQERGILFTPSDGNDSAMAVPSQSTGPKPETIPTELRDAVRANPGVQQIQVITTPVDGTRVSTIIIGSQLKLGAAGDHELYYFFPLLQQAATLSMIQHTFIAGTVVLIVLLGLVSFLVTRLVVDPVREAATVAERLASGRLNERMHVRGEDDLARLAMAFNGMADHIQKQLKEMQDLAAMEHRFVSDVSHELRTPLTTIRMGAEYLHHSRDEFPEHLARPAELLVEQVERFEALLTDLLEISRFDAGAATLEREDSDLRDVVTTVVEGAQALADDKGCEIVVLGDEQPHRCEMDPRRVERILRNLVVNAIEHGESEPIEIELGSSETAVAVAVRDHGIGLKPGDADLVFNRFWRADPARKRTTGGTGLGLAIALEDARLHDGWLHAWGEPGKGARFRLCLPRVAGRPIGYPPLPLADPEAIVPDEAPAATGSVVPDPPATPLTIPPDAAALVEESTQQPDAGAGADGDPQDETVLPPPTVADGSLAASDPSATGTADSAHEDDDDLDGVLDERADEELEPEIGPVPELETAVDPVPELDPIPDEPVTESISLRVAGADPDDVLSVPRGTSRQGGSPDGSTSPEGEGYR